MLSTERPRVFFPLAKSIPHTPHNFWELNSYAIMNNKSFTERYKRKKTANSKWKLFSIAHLWWLRKIHAIGIHKSASVLLWSPSEKLVHKKITRYYASIYIQKKEWRHSISRVPFEYCERHWFPWFSMILLFSFNDIENYIWNEKWKIEAIPHVLCKSENPPFQCFR